MDKKKTGKTAMAVAAILVFSAVWLMAAPEPAGLSGAGQRVLGIAMLAIGLWIGEVLPMGVTAVLVVMSLMISGAVPGFQEALIGFSGPVPYFLIAVLTICGPER